MSYINVDFNNDKVMNIVINRPDKRNAFQPEMIEEITEAFLKAERDKARFVSLSGEGESFCAGADLGWMKSMINYSEEENLKDSYKLFEMFFAAFKCDSPIITKVQGHAMGGALGLVAVSDIVAAVENTKFAFSEVRIGLIPAVISTFALNKMNFSKAQEFMITGRIFEADEAKSSGLVQFVGDEDSVNQYVEAQRSQFFQVGPDSVRKTKSLLRNIKGVDVDRLKKLTCETIAEQRVSEEGQEGLASFFEKRKPKWWQS